MQLMHYFGLKATTDTPTINVFTANIEFYALPAKQKHLYNHLKAIIDHYVIPREYHLLAPSSTPNPIFSTVTLNSGNDAE